VALQKQEEDVPLKRGATKAGEQLPKRVIDFEALWASDKLAACPVWARREYAWLYGLADASGSFELTNLRVLWGKVAAIRPDLSIKRLEQVFAEFHRHGLLFLWERSGKRYGHWTGSDVPGRLPPPSWRARLERLAPAVPADLLAGYLKAFGTSPVRTGQSTDLLGDDGSLPSLYGANCLNQGVEAPQAVNRDLDSKWEREEGEGVLSTPTESGQTLTESGQVPTGPEQSRFPGSAERLCGPPIAQETGRAPLEATAPGPYQSDEVPVSSAGVALCRTGAGPGRLHEIWEQERGALPAVQAITRDRLSKCATRLRNRGGDAEEFLRDFRAAVRKASETPFLLGENERGWRVSFDWFIANDTNYLKVLEGRYDGTQRTNPTRAAERRSVTARALSRVFAGAEELAGPVQRALSAGDQRAECGGLPRRPGGPDGRAA
jgi:hypothetical protein